MNTRTRLQLALDTTSLADAIAILRSVANYVDIIEVGTPLLKSEGIKAIAELRRLYPEKPLVADTKTMDVGHYEADLCFGAGADMVTVLGVADDGTIEGAVNSAKKHARTIMVDLINVDQPVPRARRAKEIGAHLVGIHSGIDQQAKGMSPMRDLQSLTEAAIGIPVSVAGGINADTVATVMRWKPSIVVVGGAITGARHPERAAAQIRSQLAVTGHVAA